MREELQQTHSWYEGQMWLCWWETFFFFNGCCGMIRLVNSNESLYLLGQC